MSRNKRLAYRLRWWILIVGLMFMAAGVAWVILPVWPGMGRDENMMGIWGTPAMIPLTDMVDNIFGTEKIAYAFNIVLYIGAFLVTQWLFLRPCRGLSVDLTRSARPTKRSVIVAALMATLLSIGGIATLLQIPNWWRIVLKYTSPGGTDGDHDFPHFGVWIAMALMWAGWSWVFFKYWRQGDRYTQFGKMIRGLVAGSVLEMIVAGPVQAFSYSEEDCYCCKGSYTGLIFGGTVLMWAFGPGVVLLFLREKYRHEKLLVPHCSKCRYSLKGSSSDTCPECGEPIDPELDRGLG